MKKSVIYSAMALIIAVGLLFGLLHIIAGSDIPPPNTDDLAPAPVTLPPERNAYFLWNNLGDIHYHEDADAFRRGEPADTNAIRAMIASNTPLWQTIRQGLDLDGFQAPPVTDFNEPLYYLPQWRAAARALAVKIQYERIGGKRAQATDDCIVLLRFGERIQTGSGCILHHLVATAILGIGFEQARHLARDPEAELEDLKRLSQALADTGPFESGLIRALQAEFQMLSNLIEQIRESRHSFADELTGLSSGLEGLLLRSYWLRHAVFLPNQTRAWAATHFRAGIASVPHTFADIKAAGMPDSFPAPQQGFRRLLVRNMFGRNLLIWTTRLETLQERQAHIHCDISATLLIAALNAWRRQHGSLPETLQELVPDLLAAVPADPYDGQPFRYDREQGIVYAVGPNLRDDGGSGPDPIEPNTLEQLMHLRWQANDIVFWIDEPPIPALTED